MKIGLFSIGTLAVPVGGAGNEYSPEVSGADDQGVSSFISEALAVLLKSTLLSSTRVDFDNADISDISKIGLYY